MLFQSIHLKSYIKQIVDDIIPSDEFENNII